MTVMPDFVGGDIIAFVTGGVLVASGLPESGEPVMSTATKKYYRLADRLILKHGSEGTFYYETNAYDPTTGQAAVTDTDTYVAKVIPPYEFDAKMVDGDMVRVGDALTGVAARRVQSDIKAGLQISIMSEVWTVVRYWPIVYHDTILMYLFHIRK